ncbi:hypothetical protein SAMCFNEI73_pC0446 (plasmid) [Sinorhizobium americanum]|uniref:Uncharacterized protein n=1 Tax=Sinorhizobium americanum TaxID=194963 RepID=A0A1L3LVP0_9HYPH|nr:hypothetical protein SAMCFNEI73_pC0446 [Sinorhizobium americanum]
MRLSKAVPHLQASIFKRLARRGSIATLVGEMAGRPEGAVAIR